jgi:methenyltetrahydromethanopterin cyclohydrolase
VNTTRLESPPTLGQLNRDTVDLVAKLRSRWDRLRIREQTIPDGGTLIDFGLNTPGGLKAGLALARICLAGRASVRLAPSVCQSPTGLDVVVQTDDPIAACMGSQYAGWALKVNDYFAMGSGPVRALARVESLFEDLHLPDEDDTAGAVGVLETTEAPTSLVFARMAERCEIPADRLTLCVAPTRSQAGMVQVVARSVETALHQLHELKFNLARVRSGFGSAPLPPCGGESLRALGRSNDAILYGGCVTLWVTGDDDSLAKIGPSMISAASDDYGHPFLEVFERNGGDFYKIDPKLFAPAVVRLVNLDSGRLHSFGSPAPELLKRSFGG